MRIQGNMISAEEGLVLRRIADKEIFGESIALGKVYYIGGELIEDGYDEKPEDYEEGLQVGAMWFEPSTAQKIVLTDKDALVESMVRLKYSERDELNLLRNQGEGYDEYKAWCDQVKEASESMMFEEQTELDIAKREKIADIDAYDTSEAVNSFTMGGQSVWIDKATRVGLVNSTNMLKQIGEENTTLWLGNISMTLPCDTVLGMLCQIEVYALACYNVTAQHKAAVNAMTDIESIKAYEYKQGYPKRLAF